MSNSEMAAIHLEKGTHKIQEERYREALTDLNEAIKLYAEGYARACFNRGIAHASLRNTSEAEVDFENALHFAAKTEDARLQQGIKEALQKLREKK